jgi:hypothetical protein
MARQLTFADREETWHVLGEDYPARFAAADEALGRDAVHAAGTRIVEAYTELLAVPETQPETEGVVPIRLVREALADVARELFDAGIRFLDTQPEDFASYEGSELDEPSPADLAAAVFVEVDGAEVYLINAIAVDVDGTW